MPGTFHRLSTPSPLVKPSPFDQGGGDEGVVAQDGPERWQPEPSYADSFTAEPTPAVLQYHQTPLAPLQAPAPARLAPPAHATAPGVSVPGVTLDVQPADPGPWTADPGQAPAPNYTAGPTLETRRTAAWLVFLPIAAAGAGAALAATQTSKGPYIAGAAALAGGAVLAAALLVRE